MRRAFCLQIFAATLSLHICAAYAQAPLVEVEVVRFGRSKLSNEFLVQVRQPEVPHLDMPKMKMAYVANSAVQKFLVPGQKVRMRLERLNKPGEPFSITCIEGVRGSDSLAFDAAAYPLVIDSQFKCAPKPVCESDLVNQLSEVPVIMGLTSEERMGYYAQRQRATDNIWACIPHKARCAHHWNDQIEGEHIRDNAVRRLAALEKILGDDQTVSVSERASIAALVSAIKTRDQDIAGDTERKAMAMPAHMARYATRMVSSKLDELDGAALALAGVSGMAAIRCK